jgi:ATP-dependent Clp protease ATP-binding subunit ClpB
MTSEGVTGPEDEVPGWAQELVARLAVSSQFVLAGNVSDLHVHRAPDGARARLRSTAQVLRQMFVAAGYDLVLYWHVVGGLAVLHPKTSGAGSGPPEGGAASDEGTSLAVTLLGQELWDRREQGEASVLAEILSRVALTEGFQAAIVVEGAPLLSAAGGADQETHRLYVTAQRLALFARRCPPTAPPHRRVYNPMVWIVERESELPHWLISAHGVQVLSVPQPTLEVRSRAASLLVHRLPGFESLTAAQRQTAQRRMAEESEGLSLAEMDAVVRLAADREIGAGEVENAVRFLRSGLSQSPWRDPQVRRRISSAADTLGEGVLGQPRAVRAAADILARAALGLAGAQSAGHSGRPQGVMFFAGPTGVGKTELAKRIATVVFGREDAMVRFDMSEFSAGHTEARLLGAPPGYVGHEAGGELTNAVRNRPFSLLLFDEIEKANPRILDKFLQILEDGRLTDGAGSTVHFSETLIVFTSNLGVRPSKDDGEGGQDSSGTPYGTPYDELARRVKAAISDAFVKEIRRPELLNRFGDNIVVFDYVQAEIGTEIARRNLEHLALRVQSACGVTLLYGKEFLDTLLLEAASDRVLVNGGRGVGSLVESWVVNPLARQLLRITAHTVEIAGCHKDEHGRQLTLVPVTEPARPVTLPDGPVTLPGGPASLSRGGPR